MNSLSLPLFPLSRCWGAARNFSNDSSDSIFHPPLSLVFFFQSSPSPAFLTSLLTQSSHLSLGLNRLLLPSSRNSTTLFGSLSSAILSTCPAHCSLVLTRLSIKLLCSPVYSLNSTFLLLSALFTLAIFRTQLFSHTCISVSAKVSVPCRHAGVTVWVCIRFNFEIRSVNNLSSSEDCSTDYCQPVWKRLWLRQPYWLLSINYL